MELNLELLEKIKDVKSVEDVIALAKESGIEFNAEDAEKALAAIGGENELDLESLEKIFGGSSSGIRHVFKDW